MSSVSKFGGICSKRKQLLEDLNLLKKLKINETSPGTSTVVIDSGFYSVFLRMCLCVKNFIFQMSKQEAMTYATISQTRNPNLDAVTRVDE